MTKRNIKKILMAFLFLVIILLAIMCCFFVINNNIKFKQNVSFEINSKHTINELVKKNNNVKIINKNQTINTSKLGKNTVIIKYKILLLTLKKDIYINIVDTTKPKISYIEKIYASVGVELNLLDNVLVEDNSKEIIIPTIDGSYDLNVEGTYNLKYIAKDSSNNRVEKDFVLIVSNDNKLEERSNKTNEYYTEVIRNQNVVIVYGLDDNNEYTKIIKVFPCSVGLDDGTPTGIFTTTSGQRWHPLFGNVYGQYTTRITGHILFHSVPYTKASPDALEYEEYNKLGSAASMGCIRMRVADVKWIYDNCKIGMTVKIYDGNLPNGVSKPTVQKIDPNSPNRGWDPTDLDPENPW